MSLRSSPHIAIVGNGIGAFRPFRIHLLSTLIESGYFVTAVLPLNGKTEAEIKTAINVPGLQVQAAEFDPHSSNPLHEWQAFKAIYEALKITAPDIVFNLTIKPALYGSLAAKKLNLPNVYSMFTGLGYLFSNKSLSDKIKLRLALPLLRNALKANSKIIFHNADDRHLFLSLGLASIDQAFTVPGSGVDIFEFSSAPIFNQPFTFLMISRLLADKGIREFVKAAEVAKQHMPHLTFIHIGDRSSNPTCLSDRELLKLKKSGVVHFLGPVSDVRPYIARSSVIVLPSYREGLPRSLLEAMSMGRPVITTNVPGCRSVIDKNVEGLIVAPQSPAELADAMLSMAQNPDKLKEMGRNARNRAVNLFDQRIVTDKLFDILELNRSIPALQSVG